MDRKSIIILVVCFVLLFALQPIVNRIFPPIRVPVSTNHVASVTGPAGSNAVESTNGTVNHFAQITSTPGVTKLAMHYDIPEQLIVLSNENARYTFTSRGGGLKDAQLLHYPESVSARRTRKSTNAPLATLNDGSEVPVFAILSDESLQGDGAFQLSGSNGVVRAEKNLPSGLTMVKEFRLSTNYLITAQIRLENHSPKALTVPTQELVVGTATPMDPQDVGFGEAVLWFNGAKSVATELGYFDTNTTSWFGLASRTPKTEFVAGSNDVAWVSAQNQYFVLGTIPQKPSASLLVRMVNLPPPTSEEIRENPTAVPNPRGLQASMIYPGLRLEPGQATTNSYNIYAGPKEYQTLATIAAAFNNDFDLVMNFGLVGPVSKALLVAMNWLHGVLGLGYGWLIIIITVVLKAIFWPITRASARSAKRMAALQPQLKALQEKYKDDPQKAQSKQWEFYKANHVNPLSGCLPALLQIPVFLGFYWMLRTAIELRGAQFLWMGDLSRPDTVYSLVLPLQYVGWSAAYFPLNPMPLIMGVTLLWQASTTPMSPSMDASQQKIMKYMPLMMLFFMYRQPSGLALYWTVSNLLTIVQTKLTRNEPTPAPPPAAGKPVVALRPQKK